MKETFEYVVLYISSIDSFSSPFMNEMFHAWERRSTASFRYRSRRWLIYNTKLDRHDVTYAMAYIRAVYGIKTKIFLNNSKEYDGRTEYIVQTFNEDDYVKIVMVLS